LSNRILSVLALCVLVGLAGCGGSDSTTAPSEGPLVTEDLVVGTGATAVAGDTVTVNYVGYFLDGTVFDASAAHGAPYVFVLGSGAVIKGWDQGIPGMKVGGKRRLTIPSSLAYGSTGYGVIPPSTTIKFDIELVSIQGK